MVDRILETIKENKLVLEGETIVAGVSGGADSMALLHILYELRSKLKVGLIVAHLDHQIRPNSDKDLAFVQAQAQTLGLPFISATEDVKGYSEKKGLSLEDAAREKRYDFLKNVAVSNKAEKVAVGHTKEDQAETVLLRMLRGSGMKGLQGMRYSRSLGTVSLIRPLLEISKENLRVFLKEKGIVWREDPTNQDISLTRNRVREKLLPLLQKDFNPKIVEELCRISKILVVENEYLEKETRKIFNELVNPLGMTLTLSLKTIIPLDLALQRRLIREIYHSLLPYGNLSYQHVESVLSFLKNSQSGKEIVLPGGVKAWFEFDQFFMGWREFENFLAPEIIEVPGEKMIHSGGLQLKVTVRRHLGKERLHFTRDDLSLGQIWDSFSSGEMLECSEYFNGDKIRGPVMIRSRQSGDFYDPIGLGSFKKAKEILIDEKVPLHLRNHVPFFVSNGKIFWIGGYRISESFKVQPDTQEILEVRLKMIASDQT